MIRGGPVPIRVPSGGFGHGDDASPACQAPSSAAPSRAAVGPLRRPIGAEGGGLFGAPPGAPSMGPLWPPRLQPICVARLREVPPLSTGSAQKCRLLGKERTFRTAVKDGRKRSGALSRPAGVNTLPGTGAGATPKPTRSGRSVCAPPSLRCRTARRPITCCLQPGTSGTTTSDAGRRS